MSIHIDWMGALNVEASVVHVNEITSLAGKPFFEKIFTALLRNRNSNPKKAFVGFIRCSTHIGWSVLPVVTCAYLPTSIRSWMDATAGYGRALTAASMRRVSELIH